MSRIAKAAINVPSGVEITLDSNDVKVKGPKGQLSQIIHERVGLVVTDNVIQVKPKAEERKDWAMAGTTRTLVNNMITGVTVGFEKTLELVGVGYRAQVKGSTINLSLGFSHPIDYKLPEGVIAETPSNTVIVLKSMDKQKLGQTAAEIRSYRPPEPYKGKGVRYKGEAIIRKETKKK